MLLVQNIWLNSQKLNLAARNPKDFKFTHSGRLAVLLDFAAIIDNTLTGWPYCQWHSTQAHPSANAAQQCSALNQTWVINMDQISMGTRRRLITVVQFELDINRMQCSEGIWVELSLRATPNQTGTSLRIWTHNEVLNKAQVYTIMDDQ